MQKKLILCCLLSLVMSTGNSQQFPSTDEEFEKSYQTRIKKERLHGIYIPKDLADAFIQLNKLIDHQTKEQFRNMQEEQLHKLGYLGVWIISNWGFYEGSRLSHYLKEVGIHHPEDMAHFIILTYHRNLNRNKLNVKTLVDFYQQKEKEKLEKKQKEGTILHEEKRIRPRN